MGASFTPPPPPPPIPLPYPHVCPLYPLYSRMEASVKMLVYVVNILTMFVGPDSWGDVTEAGLEEAIFVYLLKKRKTFTFVLRYGNICE